MVTFKISTVVGVWGKKLGKEEISVEISEWEMFSILKSLSHWNKGLYKKLKVELINEAVEEGYEITINRSFLKIKCPKCKEEIEL